MDLTGYEKERMDLLTKLVRRLVPSRAKCCLCNDCLEDILAELEGKDMNHLDLLKKNGLTPDMEALGGKLGIDWAKVWALVRQYGIIVIQLLPQLLPLIEAGDWPAVLALILANLHAPVPTPIPAVTA